MKTIAILSQKGGAGKTTLAIHLAVAAHQTGSPVLIFDIDEQASAYKWFKRRQVAAATPVTPYVKTLQAVALEEALQVKHGAELVLIDTPPSTNPGTLTAAELADLVLIPLKPTMLDLEAIPNTIRLAHLAGKEPLVILTMVEPQGSLHEEFREKIRGLQIEVCPYSTGRRVAYHHGLIGAGQTALEYDPRGKAATEIRMLYRFLTKRLADRATRETLNA